MSETTKTMGFVGAAVVVLIAAYATKPSLADLDLESYVGEPLGKPFSPEDAKQLKIVEFDEDTATLRQFEVAQDDLDIWTLPSKNGYPADADEQMGKAVGTLLDRDILAVVSNSAADHEPHGVIDPLGKIDAGQKGVGTRVTVSNINDEVLTDIIIGKDVKDEDDQYYVRLAKQDAVYVTEIDPGQLSTDFEDWIEDDLLKLNSWDIQQVRINDYSIELVSVGLFEVRPDWQRRGEYWLRYDDQDSKWIAESLRTFDSESGEFVDAPLSETEELDSDKLRELKDALDDLRIVDVEMKPSGLSANLKAGDDFLTDEQAFRSLMGRGFTAVKNQQDELELLSSEGEVICTMKDGVEYVLRFGNLQVTSGGENEEEQTEDGQKAQDAVSRYLFVMARFNEDAVKRPELQDLPELPEATEGDPAEQASAGDQDAPDDTDPNASSEDDNGAAEPTDDSASQEEDEDVANAGDTTDADAGEADVEGADPAADENAEAADPDDSSDAQNEKTEDGQDDDLAKVIEERKRIEKENQRKLDEYKEKRDKGRETVNDLNARFGDWYYVIANDVFQKIRLTRENLVNQKEVDEDDAASQADDVSDFGAPGSTVPGLPDVSP